MKSENRGGFRSIWISAGTKVLRGYIAEQLEEN